jgi:membrane protease YdiL (CAAX protease family)
MNELFFNSVGRLRSGWRFAIFVALFLVVSTIFSFGLVAILQLAGLDPQITNFIYFTVGNLFTGAAAILLGWGCNKLLENLPFRALGCWFTKNWFKDLVLGLGLGVFSILIAAAVASLLGGISFQINQTAQTSSIFSTVGISLIIFIFGAISEEAIFRGYILQTLTRARLAWLGILLTSLPFAIAHLGNPNANYFSTINTALAGIWFGVAYLKTRNLWFPVGIHLTWNWVQGAFLGIPVSGLKELTPNSIWQAVDVGPTWLTGGHYGIEGGFACTLALSISTLLIWLLPVFKPTAEMLTLTGHENPKTVKDFDLPPPDIYLNQS